MACIDVFLNVFPQFFKRTKKFVVDDLLGGDAISAKKTPTRNTRREMERTWGREEIGKCVKSPLIQMSLL